MATSSARKTLISLYIDPDQHAKLKALSKNTRVTVADYLREGVDLVLAKYAPRSRTPKKQGSKA